MKTYRDAMGTYLPASYNHCNATVKYGDVWRSMVTFMQISHDRGWKEMVFSMLKTIFTLMLIREMYEDVLQ